ncbi:MAG TPA: CHRD domain-containing protein, partial [Armatimonadota bacterium]
SSPIVGSGAFPAAHLADLFAGNVYVNIHTAVYPGGEIRGQLILQHQVPEPTTALALVPALVPVGLMLRRRRRAVA